jgi:hypothetical protein
MNLRYHHLTFYRKGDFMLIHYKKDNKRPFSVVLQTDKVIIVKYEGALYKVKEWCYCGSSLFAGLKAGFNVDLVPLDTDELEKYSEAMQYQ